MVDSVDACAEMRQGSTGLQAIFDHWQVTIFTHVRYERGKNTCVTCDYCEMGTYLTIFNLIYQENHYQTSFCPCYFPVSTLKVDYPEFVKVAV